MSAIMFISAFGAAGNLGQSHVEISLTPYSSDYMLVFRFRMSGGIEFEFLIMDPTSVDINDWWRLVEGKVTNLELYRGHGNGSIYSNGRTVHFRVIPYDENSSEFKVPLALIGPPLRAVLNHIAEYSG